MREFPEYLGQTYNRLSVAAASLIKKMNETGNWFDDIDRLIYLRHLMRRETNKAFDSKDI